MRSTCSFCACLIVGVIEPRTALAASPACAEDAAALEHELRAKAGPGDLSVRVEPQGAGVHGELRVASPNVPPLRRVVQGATCSEVLEALGFAFQMHMDSVAPESVGRGPADARDPHSPAQSSPTRGTVETESSQGNGASPEISGETAETGAEAIAPGLRPGDVDWKKHRVRLVIGPVVDWSYANEMALGLQLAGQYRLWEHHWLGVTLGYAQTGFFAANVAPPQTDALSVALTWAIANRIGRSPFHASVELGPRLSWIDVSVAPGTASDRYASLEGLVLLGLSADVAPRVELEVLVGAVARLLAGPRNPEVSGTTTLQSSNLGGAARLGVSAIF